MGGTDGDDAYPGVKWVKQLGSLAVDPKGLFQQVGLGGGRLRGEMAGKLRTCRTSGSRPGVQNPQWPKLKEWVSP